MVQRLLIPGIIVDVERDGFQVGNFGGERVEEGVVLSIIMRWQSVAVQCGMGLSQIDRWQRPYCSRS